MVGSGRVNFRFCPPSYPRVHFLDIAAHAKAKENESRAKQRRKKQGTRNRATGKKNFAKETTEAVKKAVAGLQDHTFKMSWNLAFVRKASDE